MADAQIATMTRVNHATRIGNRQFECLACASPIVKYPKSPSGHAGELLPCGHWHCVGCLRRNLTISFRTVPFRPPTCCQPIPPVFFRILTLFSCPEPLHRRTSGWQAATANVEPAVPTLDAYRERYAEWQARGQRLLRCGATPGCNAFIPPSLRPREGAASRAAKCPKCKGKTCISCSTRFHFGPCPKPTVKVKLSAEEFLERQFAIFARSKRWRRCPECRRWVEKTEGCNHISCICGCHWCYRCGRAPYSNHGPCSM